VVQGKLSQNSSAQCFEVEYGSFSLFHQYGFFFDNYEEMKSQQVLSHRSPNSINYPKDLLPILVHTQPSLISPPLILKDSRLYKLSRAFIFRCPIVPELNPFFYLPNNFSELELCQKLGI